MRKEDKLTIIDQIKSQIGSYVHLYIADTTGMNAVKTSNLRRECFKSDVKLMVVKNTLLQKALESSNVDYAPLYDALKGTSALMLSNVGNLPARIIKDFAKANGGLPTFKAAYVEENAYVGAELLDVLVNIKSKNELIADVIALLQTPARNVISALQNQNKSEE